MQDRLGVVQDQPGAEADHQRQPEGLAHDRADLRRGPGTVVLGDLGRGGEQDAGHQQEYRHPDRVAQCHGSQVPRADAPGHHRIDEAHGGMRQLGDDDRQGQSQQVAHFQQDARRPGEGRGVSNGIHQ